MDGQSLKVGELARRTGLSVRTLHHYDEIGLLSPGARTSSGHRLYGPAEVERLQRIVSLRQLGFSLDEIADCLERSRFTLERVLALHIERAREHIEAQERLVRRLETLADHVRTADVSMDELLDTIEVTAMFDRYYTPEQREQLAGRAEAMGPEAMQAAQDEWADVFETARRLMDAGADPADPEVQALAGRARELTDAFTGGDPEVAESLRTMYAENPDLGARWGFDPEIRAFLERARQASADA